MEQKNLKLLVEADYNDGDYITELSSISEEDLAKLKGLLNKIDVLPIGFNGFDWGSGEVKGEDNNPRVIYKDQLTEDEIEWLEGYFPYGDYGIHSIESIKVIEIVDEL